MKIKEYDVCMQDNAFNLMTFINDRISQGWTPIGGVSVDDRSIYMQSVVKYEEEKEELTISNKKLLNDIDKIIDDIPGVIFTKTEDQENVNKAFQCIFKIRRLIEKYKYYEEQPKVKKRKVIDCFSNDFSNEEEAKKIEKDYINSGWETIYQFHSKIGMVKYEEDNKPIAGSSNTIKVDLNEENETNSDKIESLECMLSSLHIEFFEFKEYMLTKLGLIKESNGNTTPYLDWQDNTSNNKPKYGTEVLVKILQPSYSTYDVEKFNGSSWVIHVDSVIEQWAYIPE